MKALGKNGLYYGDIRLICESTGLHRDTVRRVLLGEFKNMRVWAAVEGLKKAREMDKQKVKNRIVKNYARRNK